MGEGCDWNFKARPGTKWSEMEEGAAETELDVGIMCKILWN